MKQPESEEEDDPEEAVAAASFPQLKYKPKSIRPEFEPVIPLDGAATVVVWIRRSDHGGG